jgi:hypothetical protein
MSCSIQINRNANPESECKWVDTLSDMDKIVRLAVIVAVERILEEEDK